MPQSSVLDKHTIYSLKKSTVKTPAHKSGKSFSRTPNFNKFRITELSKKLMRKLHAEKIMQQNQRENPEFMRAYFMRAYSAQSLD